MKMNMKKKLVGYLKQYRWFALEYKKSLSDQEYRLLDVYAGIARWDPRDKERFGMVDTSIRDTIDQHLPNWSVGKMSETRTSLVKKGFLIKHPKNIFYVDNFEIYSATFRKAERILQCIEQGIQPTEQHIRQNEQQERIDLQDKMKNLVDKYKVTGL